MRMKFSLLTLFLLVHLPVQGQDTTYFDSEWGVSTKKRIKFYLWGID